MVRVSTGPLVIAHRLVRDHPRQGRPADVPEGALVFDFPSWDWHGRSVDGNGSCTRRSLSAVGCLALCAFVIPPTFARAQERDVARASLAWRSESSVCLGASTAAEAVNAILGRVALTTARAQLIVSVHVAPVGTGHRAQVELRSESRGLLGERDLVDDDPQCRALSEGLPLALALMIDDLGQRRTGTLRVGVARLREAATQWRLALQIGAGADLGRMPEPGPLAHARAALRLPGSPLAFVVRFAAMLPIESTGPSGGGMRAWSAGGALGASLELVRVDAVRLDLETIFESALLEVAGIGLEESNVSQRWTGAALVGGLVSLRLEMLEVSIELALGVPVVHRRFVFTAPDGSDALVYESLPVFGRAALLVGLVAP